MAHIFKPTAVKPIPASAVIKTVKGVRYAVWTNRKHVKVTAELTADGKKCRVESPTWWIEYTGPQGGKERAKGFRDKGATMGLAAKLEARARDVRAGIDTPRHEGPAHLADHLTAFREHLEAKGNGAPHVASVMHNVTAVITGLSLTTPATVDCPRITSWLAGERKRNGWSQANVNRYILFLRSFGRWLVQTGRARANPFEGLAQAKTNGVKTRERRRLADDELRRLIQAAKLSATPLLSLPGPDRARLYLMAAYTGLRIGTLSKLTPGAFAWRDGLPVTVTAGGRIVKNKKPHTVPIHPSVAAELAEWLAARPTGRPTFPKGDWSERGASLVAHDLAAARAAWIGEAADPVERARREAADVLNYRNSAGEVFDFHALRVQFISGLALAGVPLTAAQQLADHSTPSLTSNIYTRYAPAEMAQQVAKLPGFGANAAG
jgi:integrase